MLHRQGSLRLSLTPCVLLLGGVMGAISFAAPTATSVEARLEPSQAVYYEGAPVFVRVSVANRGAEATAYPLQSPLFAGLTVRASGSPASLPVLGAPSGSDPERPERLAPGGSHGRVFDASELYPTLRSAGTYELDWASDGIVAPRTTIRVIPRYDAEARYTAQVHTAEGTFDFELLSEHSPIAVKTFVDLARAGFYDGRVFGEVHVEEFVVGGSPNSTAGAEAPMSFPAELSNLALATGMVVMRPFRPSPPSNGPEFIVLLEPQGTWAGQVTVVGRIQDGLEVVRRLSRLPSTGGAAAPFFKPLQEAKIHKVIIRSNPNSAESGAPRTR